MYQDDRPDKGDRIPRTLLRQLMKNWGFLAVGGYSPLAWAIFIVRTLYHIQQHQNNQKGGK